MKIRRAEISDHDQIWEIFSQVIQSGDTYVFDPQTPKSALSSLWLADNMTTYVAEVQGQILGTYIIKPNQPDLGNHIANGSYMVHPDARGKGIGAALCKHSIQMATEAGYEAIQFNLVVSTNTTAISLWEKFGFRIIGTTPRAFRHARLGHMDAHIMYREL